MNFKNYVMGSKIYTFRFNFLVISVEFQIFFYYSTVLVSDKMKCIFLCLLYIRMSKVRMDSVYKFLSLHCNILH